MQAASRDIGADRQATRPPWLVLTLVAAAVFAIPYERLKARHPLARQDREQPLYRR